MKYILYFGGYDNDTYFYKSLKELVKHWHCSTLEEFINKYKNSRYGVTIFKIDKIIYDSDGDKE